MSKPQRNTAPPPASLATLPARAVAALHEGKFKEAIDLFKQLIRQEPRAEWRESLADAYAGRARALAAKGMFKETALVLENTLAPDTKLLREPALYVSCLIREGQSAKAATYLLHCVARNALPADLEDLTAAVLLSLPQLPPAPAAAAPPGLARWREQATIARAALAAWIDGAPAEAVDCHVAKISLRSAFRPVRLLLKSLITQPPDPARAAGVLASIAPGSPFQPLRDAAEAALRGGASLESDTWARLAPAAQAFVAETGGIAPESLQAITRLSDAARGGPGGLFTWLLKQHDLPAEPARSACFNMLPALPDRIGQFETRFGPLSERERLRIRALAAESREQWGAAERAWRELAQSYRDSHRESGERLDALSAGAIYRHLVALCRAHPDETGDDFPHTQLHYLESAAELDPDHLPTTLAAIAQYRSDGRPREWHQAVDDAVRRFPDESQILLAAIDSAVARQAYKTATGFARRLLKIDPINTTVRQRMIELQVAHARKQMRGKRPDLAAQELAQASEWDRADAPSALLRTARGLVALRAGDNEAAMALLREAAGLGGGDAAGWFRVVLEADLMKFSRAETLPLKIELDRARRAAPTRAGVLALASAIGQPEAIGGKRAVRNLLVTMSAWLEQGAAIAWTQDEFLRLAESFTRWELYELLQAYAAAARRREPTNPEWRFQEIVGRTRGHHLWMTVTETDEVHAMVDAAMDRKDFHARTRLLRFLDQTETRSSRHEMDVDIDDLNDISEQLAKLDPRALLDSMGSDMPKGALKELRAMADDLGREAAIEMAISQFAASPFGRLMPPKLFRAMCTEMIDAALANGPAGRKGRR